jgi:hypothetical protein
MSLLCKSIGINYDQALKTFRLLFHFNDTYLSTSFGFPWTGPGVGAAAFTILTAAFLSLKDPVVVAGCTARLPRAS